MKFLRRSIYFGLFVLSTMPLACAPPPGSVRPRTLDPTEVQRQASFMEFYRNIVDPGDCVVPQNLGAIIGGLNRLLVAPDDTVPVKRDIVAHDCQRLIDDDWSLRPPKIAEKTYYATVAVLAILPLDTMSDAYFDSLDGSAALVGVVINADREQGFADLEIEPDRTYCVYVGLDADGNPNNSEDWWAALEPCSIGPTLETTDRPLRVRREVLPSGPPPPVAVFHWEESGRENSLGIRCGGGWCSLSKDRPRVHVDHGRGDEQYLALPNEFPNRIAPLRARIAPVPGLAGIIDFDDKWVKIADIQVIAGDHSDYAEKLNVVSGARSEVFLRRKTDAGLPETQRWVMKITRAGREPLYREVLIHDNPLNVVAGTARWKWVSTDERFWTSCIPGCCEMTDTQHPPLE